MSTPADCQAGGKDLCLVGRNDNIVLDEDIHDYQHFQYQGEEEWHHLSAANPEHSQNCLQEMAWRSVL